MSLSRILLRSLRRAPSLSPVFLPTRSYAFSSAEEAAAERRRRKRRLRIEPPLNALRRDPNLPRPPPDPRQPESTSSLVGPRLNLHNRVQSLIRAFDLDSASSVARQAVFSSVRPTVFTCNALIAAFYRNGRYADSVALFHYFFKQSNIVPNVVSYNFLILAHCDSGHVDKAIEVYNEILSSAPFSPSYVSYRNLTKGLVEAGRIQEAVDYLREMINKGNGADSLVFNNLILGFLNLGNLDKAVELFDELKERCSVYDGVLTATFMDWFFKNGRDKEAMEYYRDLLAKEFKMVPATCNVLLETLLRHERTNEAWALFDTMLDRHTPPTFQGVNSETFSIMVNEHCRIGKVSEAIDVFKRVGKKVGSKPFSMDVAGFNNMIIRYCEHDMLEDAEKIFNELCSKSLNPDVTTYRTLIDSYFRVGRVEDALQKYIKMVEAGLRVIPEYANKWFGILIENGKVVECAPILTKMGEKEPKPDFNTYDLVIRALCNEQNLDSSIDLVGQMQRYGVGVTDSLKGFLNEEFGKVGRGEEVDKILTMRGQGYYGYSRPAPPGNFRMPGAISGQEPTDQRYNSVPPRGNFRMPGPYPGQVPTDFRYNNAAPRGNFQMPGPNSERAANDLRYNDAAPQGNFQRPVPNSEQVATNLVYNNVTPTENFRMPGPTAPHDNFQITGPNSERVSNDLRYNNTALQGNFRMPGPNSERVANDFRYNNAAAQGNFQMPDPNSGYNNAVMPGNFRMQGRNLEQVATGLGYNNDVQTENLRMAGPNSEQEPTGSSYDNAEVNRNYARAYN